MVAPLNVIGIMTGNSMDAVDVVLTEFKDDGSIKDHFTHSKPYKKELFDALFALRIKVNEVNGRMSDLDKGPIWNGLSLDDIHSQYLELVSQTVIELMDRAADCNISVDLIGSHGQTLSHYPPSIAGKKNIEDIYTVQIGDGQKLSDITGLPVVFDFRSDDLMQGGEGAPLAPYHHKALALNLKDANYFPICFCNAGNTGNFSVISSDKDTADISVLGWDAGPFNYLPDQMMRRLRDKSCDFNGEVGKTGDVDLSLLELLFDTAVIDTDGNNYLALPPPKSSDGEWYTLIPELMTDTLGLSFQDRLRTAEYFSAYVYFHSLQYIDDAVVTPRFFALAGGGWLNPIITEHFLALLEGDITKSPILSKHEACFARIRKRFGRECLVKPSIDFGFDGTAMEARIFAHMAVSYIQDEPFTSPSLTGCRQAVTSGVIAYPSKDLANVSDALREWMNKYKRFVSPLGETETRWSRASAGWSG
jgi:anhydro-N-acetylmuramic acid kinase